MSTLPGNRPEPKARTANRPTERKTAGKTAGAGDAKAGEEVFTTNCMQCHAVNEGQNSFGPNLYHETKKASGKKTPAEIRDIIEKGKGNMPPWGDKLDAKQKDDVIAYLKTI